MLSFFAVFSIALSVYYYHHFSKQVSYDYGRVPSSTTAVVHDYFLGQIKPILDYRCVVCHSCYNSPCQLKLSSYEGITRGATKQKIYGDTRLVAAPTTRLFIDAQSTEEWRKKGFASVVSFNDAIPSSLDQSMLYKMISHNRDSKKIDGQTFKPEESFNCPLTSGEFDDYAKKNPNGGMPFGFPNLQDFEFSKLEEWIGLGAPGPNPEAEKIRLAPSNEAVAEMIVKWETFFNSQNNKGQLVARYLYEHFFLTQFYFSGSTADFYSLVRSSTPAPQPIKIIPTRRPYDDPGVTPVYYRFTKILDTIVHKTHITYELSDEKMKRFEEVFFGSEWEVPNSLPAYSEEINSNPFIVFEAIPARARYQFLLDNAQHFVMNFIRGPVCKGNIALNVIDDHFFIMFVKPDSDLSLNYPKLVEKNYSYLDTPAAGKDSVGKSFYGIYDRKQSKYVELRQKYYQKHFKRGMRMDDLWDGDGKNPNAILTVYRHKDSADVVKGPWGGIPKTAFVVDYAILERIYYSLVAGFDVFGSVWHQASTRLYMDHLRVESEDMFLSFLPKNKRKQIRDSWYEGVAAEFKASVKNKYSGNEAESEIKFSTDDVKKEFLLNAFNNYFSKEVRGPIDNINCCEISKDGIVELNISTQQEFENMLKKFANRSASFVKYFPEFSLLRVKMKEGKDLVYSIVRNRAHSNVSFMLFEDSRLKPEKDTLFFLPGYHGSYPNFYFVVNMENTAGFLREMASLDDKGIAGFITKYGIRRSDTRFWASSDWFNNNFFENHPVEAGFLDLNRYENY